MEGEDGQQRDAFTALLEKGLSSKILMSEWCTTMDIVVLVTEDGQLQLFRLNWERLWSKQPQYAIVSLTWSPDGKQLAYGDDKGYIHILAAEDGATIDKRKVFSSSTKAAVALCWTVHGPCYSSPAVGGPVGYRAPRLLSSKKIEKEFHGSSEQVRYSNPVLMGTYGSRETRNMLHMICAISAEGSGVICGEGLLPVCRFNIDDLEGQGTSKIAMAMSPNGHGLWVSYRNFSGALCVSFIDTSTISRYGDMLHTVELYLSETLKDINMVYEIMANIQKSIGEVDSCRDAHLNEMRSMLGGLRDPEKDFYDFVIRGSYSLEMKNFVAKESKLKDASKGVDTALCQAYADVVSHLQPCLERIVFRLGDLRGYALTPHGNHILGLDASEIGRCERRVLNIASLCEHLRELLLKATSGYRKFYSLLFMLCRRDMGEKYPNLPKSSIEEVEGLIISAYYTEDLHAMLDAVCGPNERQDEELLHFSRVFQTQCEMKDKSPSKQDTYQCIAEEEEKSLNVFMQGLGRWLEGKSSAHEIDMLVQESTDESMPHGIYGLDYFKAMFLRILSRLPMTLSSHVSTQHLGSLLSSVEEEDSLSMVFDDTKGVLVSYACQKRSLFITLAFSESQKIVQLAGAHMPGNLVTSTCVYKSESILVTSSVEEDSYIHLIPLESCPYCKEGPHSASDIQSVFDQLPSLSPANTAGCRTRHITQMKISSPFAASSSRGVALAIFQPPGNTIIVYDLEEDEDDEEYEEE